MAHPFLNQEDLKALDQTRQRLYQLTNNIASLKASVYQSSPLPPWSSLQNSTAIIATNIESLTTHLSKHAEVLTRTVVYPSTNYPGRTQEGLLGQLLRKKLEPQVETWVEEGRAIHGTIVGSKSKDEEELWAWAEDWIGSRVAKYVADEAGDNYTVEEREQGIENVNTGLKRKFDDDDDDNEDEDDEMEDAGVAVTSARRTSLGQFEFGLEEVKKSLSGKARTVEDILRFATSGTEIHPGLGGRR